MGTFYDFKEISERIKFKDLLDKLGIAYTQEGKELFGKFEDGTTFVIAETKNLFLCPKKMSWKGSVINFTSIHFNCSLPKACEQLTRLFKENKEPEREIPDLKLHYSPIINKMGITIETCRELEFGLVKEQRTVMAQKITFTVKDEEGNKVGYIGWNEKQGWYFPKGHKNIYLYNLHNVDNEEVILVSDPFEVAKLHAEGKDSIALMSSSMTEEQAEIIKRRFTHVIVRCKMWNNIIPRLIDSCYVKVA